MDSPKLGDKVQRVQQQGKRTNKQQHTNPEKETAEEESSPAQILERVKPDRVTASKPEEDRRRRTIIVEKKNGSFGFTLQSYGIHYKKEQEIEMITYVDYVDYDGAAFRAGMREGDVILSINGHDMEKADHKALVNFIKNCETRMRMVVLFEDCVRKVELHMRYIQLQRVLQSKMSEHERLCLRERDLLQGKWKTHSLPARKKAATAAAADGGAEIAQDEDVAVDYASCRPTVSTEDVARAHQQPALPAQQLLLAYQYLDPRYRAYFIQPAQGPNGEYHWPTQCGVIEANRAHAARHGSAKGYHQTNGMAAAGPGVPSSGKASSKPPPAPSSHHLCNPCVAAGNGDSSSLDAYDLASPCCNPHCVPSARRRSRQHKKNGKAAAHEDEEEATIVWKEVKPGRSSQLPSSSSHPPAPPHRGGPRYLAFGVGGGGGGGAGGLTSQCSLHSCTSSEMSGHAAHGSAASYTTSLSNDTLYWDDPPPHNGHAAGANGKHGAYAGGHHHPHHQHHQYVVGPQFSPYNPEKPAKSWDNLTTKAFGGYGFGYGYLDTTATKAAAAAAAAAKTNHNRAHSTKANANGSHGSRNGADHRLPSNQAGPSYQNAHSHHHIRYVQPTKSTESLLLLPKYKDSTLSDSSLSCDCLDVTSPGGVDSARQPRFFPMSNPNVSAMGEQNFGNAYHLQQGRNQGSQTDTKRNSIQEGGPDITRL